jgi:tetratricopeptide (TPR) repeat protein
MSLNTAEKFEENEQYDKAYEEYKKEYTRKSKDIYILERLGHLAVLLEKKDEAEEYFNKLLEIDPMNTLAYEQLMDIHMHDSRYKYYIARGNLHSIEKEFSHAINDFKKALNKAQTDEEINSTRFVLANLYEQVDKNHQAIDEYLRILDIAQEKKLLEMVYLKLAQIYVNENSIESAIEILERALENDIDSTNIKENLARIYLKNNQPEKSGNLTQDSLTKIRSLLDENNNQKAFSMLESNKDKYKNNAQYYSLLALYYFNIKDWKNSLKNVDEFEKFEKNSPLSYQMRALIFEEQQKDFEAHINWAKYNLIKKEKEIALNEYFLAYQLNNNDIDVITGIAELLEDTKDKIQAAEFWERLILLDKTNKRAFEKAAEFKESIGAYTEEAEILEKLYQLDDKSLITIKKLAKVYEKIKNKEKSLEFYNKFVSLSPVNEEYEKIKVKIQKLTETEFESDDGLIGKIMKLFAKI